MILTFILRAVFVAVHDHTDGFRSATSNAVEIHDARIGYDISSLYTHLDGRFAALASNPSVTMSSNSLRTGKALLLS